MVDLKPFGIEEPLVSESIAAGVNVVSFSGDKLLGGPQAGIIAGEPELMALAFARTRCSAHCVLTN